MQSVREPIALIDRELRVIMHNPAFDELYGSADGNQRIDGEHIGRIGEGNWAGREVSQRLRDVVGRGRELWDFEVEQVTADGVKRTMLLNARRMSLPGREDEVALVTLGVLVALGLGVWWVTRPVVATIAASRAGETVTFTWTYPHPRDDDAYDVWVADRVVRVGEPIVQVGADDRACMRVRVLDAAGAPRGPYSEEVCA